MLHVVKYGIDYYELFVNKAWYLYWMKQNDYMRTLLSIDILIVF